MSGSKSSGEFNKKGKRGFTLTEVLVVVGIIAILITFSVPNIINMQRSLRQIELDDKAKIIYAAAQNQLTRMEASGNISVLRGSDSISSESFHYFANTASGVSAVVMPRGTLESSLEGYNWVVEFYPETARVKAVYYSEDRNLCTASDYRSNYSRYDRSYRDYDGRLADGAKIGYHGDN